MDKEQKNKHINQILWLDLEMTGLSPSDELITEVAIIVTDWDFNELATYQGIVKNNERLLKKRFAANAKFWDENQQARDGLICQNQSGKPLKVIESEILDLINKNFTPDTPVLLAGNSVYWDRMFITKNWPRFDRKLHYRILDVSAWKVVFEGKYGKKFAKPDAHRALDDIRGSIAELQYYLSKLSK